MYPIEDILANVHQTLLNNNLVLIEAPPGAGKSTVLPLSLLEQEWLQNKKIILLEPRRIAAKSVALQLANNLNEPVGKRVGYRMRFEQKISSETIIEVITEGVFNRLLIENPTLDGIAAILFDEFHERNIHSDLGLVLCTELQNILRDDLKIIVMSATLASDELSLHFNNAPIIRSLGRQHPITFHYHHPEVNANLVDQMVRLTSKAISENQSGDVLVFLPSTGEVKKCATLLSEKHTNCSVHSLYGDLSLEEQSAAIAVHPHGLRKIICSTSIAETSITIEGVSIVIDCGYSRISKYNPQSGTSQLMNEKISLDVATQRAGRAGRLGPGVCYRLWNEQSTHQLKQSRTPEIINSDLTALVFTLFNWGIKNITSLHWITPPPKGAYQQAIELLLQLKLIDEHFQLTAKGQRIKHYPTHPRNASLLDDSVLHNSTLGHQLLSIIDNKDIIKDANTSNIMDRIHYFNLLQEQNKLPLPIRKSYHQWLQLAPIHDSKHTPHIQMEDLLINNFPERIAKRVDAVNNRYRLANGRFVSLSKNDLLSSEEWLLVIHYDIGLSDGRVFLAAAIQKSDVKKLAKTETKVEWDQNKNWISAVEIEKVGVLELNTKTIATPSEAQKISLLLDAIKIHGATLLNWNEACLQWLYKIQLLTKHHFISYPYSDVETCIQHCEDWLAPYLNDVKKGDDLFKLPLKEILNNSLSYSDQQKVQQLTPETIEVPSGSKIKVEYQAYEDTPILSVRLQELFGLADGPTILDGRLALKLHLLSPGYKPVQVTQDLKNFWNHTYHEVKKELKSRYPKHAWPDDPWTAQAVRGVKKNK
jgi:ATP-dependent helicase HrpB